MSLTARAVVNLVSLSRVGLALVFVATFGPSQERVLVCATLCAVALLTDIADGFLARRLGVASTQGRHWDSIGDKTFYIAIDISFVQTDILLSVLAWALISREIGLYIIRILYIQNIAHVEKIRPYTNWHGYFMYGMIVLGMIEMWGISLGHNYGLYVYVQICATLSVVFGLASIVSYVRLDRYNTEGD